MKDTAALEQEIAAHAAGGYALYGSGGPNPISQDEVIHFSRTHSSTWTRDAYLDEDAIPLSSVDWISSTVDCAEGPLWERHAYNAKGHVRAEATAETPLLLLDRQTPYATWDLDWMEPTMTAFPMGTAHTPPRTKTETSWAPSSKHCISQGKTPTLISPISIP